MQRYFTAQWRGKGITSERAVNLIFTNLYKFCSTAGKILQARHEAAWGGCGVLTFSR